MEEAGAWRGEEDPLDRDRAGWIRQSVLLSDDEGDGRFAGLLRQQGRQLGHSAVACLEGQHSSRLLLSLRALRVCGAIGQIPRLNMNNMIIIAASGVVHIKVFQRLSKISEWMMYKCKIVDVLLNTAPGSRTKLF